MENNRSRVHERAATGPGDFCSERAVTRVPQRSASLHLPRDNDPTPAIEPEPLDLLEHPDGTSSLQAGIASDPSGATDPQTPIQAHYKKLSTESSFDAHKGVLVDNLPIIGESRLLNGKVRF